MTQSLLPFTNPIRRCLSILRNMHEFFTYKSSIKSVSQIVQDAITWVLYNSIKSVSIFASNEVCCPSFLISMLFTSLIKVSIFFVKWKVSSLIASLGFIPIIDDTVLFILFTVLFKFLTQIVETFSGS